MFEVNLHDLDWSHEQELTRVVLVSRFNGKWVFCKKKSKETWEIPGGHIEPGEHWLEAAKRELYEETGATDADIKPICLYSISTYGLLCFAEIKNLSDIPNFEMEKIEFFDSLPDNLSYPESHTLFFNKVLEELGE